MVCPSVSTSRRSRALALTRSSSWTSRPLTWMPSAAVVAPSPLCATKAARSSSSPQCHHRGRRRNHRRRVRDEEGTGRLFLTRPSAALRRCISMLNVRSEAPHWPPARVSPPSAQPSHRAAQPPGSSRASQQPPVSTDGRGRIRASLRCLARTRRAPGRAWVRARQSNATVCEPAAS